MRDSQKVDTTIIQEANQILNESFKTKIEISTVVFLSEPERRNIVLRIVLKDNPLTNIPKTIILKQSLVEELDADNQDAFARFARDWAALEFLSSIPQRAHIVPRFYGGSKVHRFILIEDLGIQHISLVDTLTSSNREKAISALERFMKALGCFHAASFNVTESYFKILNKINQNAESWEEDFALTSNDLLSKLDMANQKFGLSTTSQLISEATQVIESIFKPGLFTSLTHGDICPDNVFDHDETHDLQLIDFEWTFVRNVLLDGTYLRMNMPTCWCAKAIPDEIINTLEMIYREELKRTIPAASDDTAYNTAYVYACAFWVLRTLPLVEDIMETDKIWPSGPVPSNSLWDPQGNFVRPRLLSRLNAFLSVTSKYDMLTHLREMASRMLFNAKKCWPQVKPLELYPAFRMPVLTKDRGVVLHEK